MAVANLVRTAFAQAKDAKPASGSKVDALKPFVRGELPVYFSAHRADDILTGFTSSVARGTATIGFTLARAPVELVFQVLRGTRVVAAPPLLPLPAGPQSLTWDGKLADGSRAPDGSYALALVVTDDVGKFTRTANVTFDTVPPRVTVISNRNLLFRVSEPATLTLTVGVRRFTRTLTKPGTTQFWLKSKPAAYVLTATDAAGNATVVRYRR